MCGRFWVDNVTSCVSVYERFQEVTWILLYSVQRLVDSWLGRGEVMLRLRISPMRGILVT